MRIEQEITNRNTSIAARYVDAISHLANDILLTGSNAWGANYAVTEKSDIDLLIIGDGVRELESIVEKLISGQLLKDSERSRFRAFRDLYKRGNAEQFSVIAYYENVPVSMDFLTVETLRKITSLSPMGTTRLEGTTVRFIKEFRINPPKVLGYSFDDLCSPRKLTYHPVFTEIKDREGTVQGYLSETAVDALEQDERNYFLGVMAFYLCVAPVVLFEKDGELTRAIHTIRSNIKSVLSRPATHVTRQDRMSEDTLRHVLEDFSPARDASFS